MKSAATHRYNTAAAFIQTKSGTTINIYIYGGTIKDNETKTDGGGVYIANTQFTLSGDAIITGNKAPNGSGGVVFAAYGSQFTTSDNAVISGNSAANYGGGVYLSGGTTSPVSSFTMNNGTISDNHSDNNGVACMCVAAACSP